MKKIMFSFIAAVALCACSSNSFTLIGTVPADTVDGSFMVFKNNGMSDTVAINEGKFNYSGQADITTMISGQLCNPEGVAIAACRFIPEKGSYTIDLASENMAKSGPVAEALNNYREAQSEISDEYFKQIEELTDGLEKSEAEDVMESIRNSANEKMEALDIETLAANGNNYIGLSIVTNKLYDLETVEQIDAYLADKAQFIRQDAKVQKIRKAAEAAELTAEGQMFVDFKGKNAADEEIALSNFVGNGKYVLVDFWASWCGPCKREIPNIIAAFNKYKGDKFTVIGVAVWDKKRDTDAAIKALGIEYEQIYCGDDKTPTDLYGINGIPHIILFGPDGTIVKRGLRGEAIEAAIKEALDL